MHAYLPACFHVFMSLFCLPACMLDVLQEQRQAALEAEETALRMQEQRQAALEAEVSASLSACQSLCMPACLFSRLYVYNNPG